MDVMTKHGIVSRDLEVKMKRDPTYEKKESRIGEEETLATPKRNKCLLEN
jgi:hypothetical protein